MLNKLKLNLVLPIYLIFSAFGLTTLIILMFFPPSPTVDIPWRKPIIGALFTVICILGGFAATIPRKCSKIFGSHGENRLVAFPTVHSNSYVVKGHHLDCGKFSSHTITLRGHVLCVACTGLFLGAIAAIIGAVAYFFAGLDIEQFGLPSIAIGIGFIALGFTQFRFSGYVRLLLNAFFVIGAFSILTGADAFMKNLFIDFYLLSLMVLWVLTRILLSEWDHSRICRFCTSECKLDE
ncbi:hypothetical protein HXY33_08200 [Candidatus Bathyarchaeota archaeon]|nr:hypothetical protein [Candidatus Bathyarchaeota archaeon]